MYTVRKTSILNSESQPPLGKALQKQNRNKIRTNIKGVNVNTNNLNPIQSTNLNHINYTGEHVQPVHTHLQDSKNTSHINQWKEGPCNNFPLRQVNNPCITKTMSKQYIIISEDGVGDRIDRYIARLFPQLTFMSISKLLRVGDIRINRSRRQP
jgi:hypothetical protein